VTGDIAVAALPIAVAFVGAAEADAQMRPIPNAVSVAKMIVRISSIPSDFICRPAISTMEYDGLSLPLANFCTASR
jgi:hypothetical protein